MDNLTHTLVGMAVAEAAVSLRAEPVRLVPASWRRAAYVVSIVAGNLPDLDLLATPLTGGKLGYLLHHRGHTHTFVAVPVMVGLVMLAVWAWSRWRPSLWTAADWRGLWGLAVFGALLHLGLDSLNSYGVHLFWPVDSRWSYGDSVFVLEPWLWAMLATPLIGAMNGFVARWLLTLVVLVGVMLVWVTGLVPPVMAAVVTLSTVAAAALARRVAPARRGWTALSLGLAFITVFAFVGQLVRQRVTGELTRAFPATRLHDLALSPLPANLLCWQIFAVGTEGEAYVVRDGIAALVPQLLAPSRCPGLVEQKTAPYVPVTVAGQASDSSVLWRGAYVLPLAELRAAARHCEVEAFLRFARVPFRLGDLWGDLRFGHGRNDGFAELPLGTVDGPCPPRVPGWVPPLDEILNHEDQDPGD